jgi:mannan endo-1,4-beta-mannosidase
MSLWSLRTLRVLAAPLIATMLVVSVAGPADAATQTSQQLLGAALAGQASAHLFGLSPQSISTIPAERTESAALGHKLNIINLFVDFKTNPTTFSARLKEASAGGAIPEITWMPCSFIAGCSASRDAFPLTNIAAGRYDSYVKSIAAAAKAFGHPVILRFAHEMNGSWYPWGKGVNGNTPARYVAAWRHVHNIFAARNATNVYWFWSPNKEGHSLSSWYPGNAYTSFVGVDGYNGPQYSSSSMTPSQVFGSSLTQLATFSSKPIIIGEVGCVEGTGSFVVSKATWITDFVSLLAHTRHAVGFVWSEFNSTKKIDTSAAAQAAMKSALARSWVSS